MKERLFWSNLGDVILVFFFLLLFSFILKQIKSKSPNGDNNNEKSKEIITY